MIKKIQLEPEQVVPSAPPPFPSPLLVVMSVISCFLATAAFVLSLTKINTELAHFLAPNGVGFILTVPYHVHLYLRAQKHRRDPSKDVQDGPTFLTSNCIIWAFLLVTLWVVILAINAQFCETWRFPVVITATVVSGLEWITLLFIALRLTQEIWLVEKRGASEVERQSTAAGASSETTPLMNAPTTTPRPIYLVSFAFCTLALVFSVYPSLLCLINVIAFFITAPYHLAIFISSVRPRSPLSLLAQPASVPFGFALAGLWCLVFILDIALHGILALKVISAIFAGLEGIIVAYLAIRCVLDSFAEGQIRL